MDVGGEELPSAGLPLDASSRAHGAFGRRAGGRKVGAAELDDGRDSTGVQPASSRDSRADSR